MMERNDRHDDPVSANGILYRFHCRFYWRAKSFIRKTPFKAVGHEKDQNVQPERAVGERGGFSATGEDDGLAEGGRTGGKRRGLVSSTFDRTPGEARAIAYTQGDRIGILAAQAKRAWCLPLLFRGRFAGRMPALHGMRAARAKARFRWNAKSLRVGRVTLPDTGLSRTRLRQMNRPCRASMPDLRRIGKFLCGETLFPAEIQMRLP
jgi:hypothetical protein